MRRKALFVSFLGSLLAGLSYPVLAHSVVDYPSDFGWKYTYLNRVFYQAPNNWPNSYNARATDAMEKWTNITGSAISFSLAGDAASDSWTACVTGHDFLTTGNLATGTLAGTTGCSNPGTPVRIKLNTDETWYTGDSTPNPASQADVEGVVAHEIGHAHQAWSHCTDGDADDEDPCEGGHYDSQYNGAICDTNDPPNHSTMCRSAPPGSTMWRWRSLEPHDIDLVQSMY